MDRTTVTLGRGIRRLVSLYDSLDDLLQAADDHHSKEYEEHNEEAVDKELTTQEAMEKKQEYATSNILSSSHYAYNVPGLKINLLRLSCSYRLFPPPER